jgi:carbon-monoxide dehydrogenase small subunit
MGTTVKRVIMESRDVQYIQVKTRVNGIDYEFEVEPRETLLELIRNRLGLKGAQLSCDMEVCGACTVLMNGMPISSCTTLAIAARGKDILTIEGLAPEEKLHPLQEAFLEKGGVQCGFCTPGMILTAKSLLDVNPSPTPDEIISYMEGNLCRCTGYKMIVEAITAAAQKLSSK